MILKKFQFYSILVWLLKGYQVSEEYRKQITFMYYVVFFLKKSNKKE